MKNYEFRNTFDINANFLIYHALLHSIKQTKIKLGHWCLKFVHYPHFIIEFNIFYEIVKSAKDMHGFT